VPFATHLSKGHKEHSTTDLLICATGCLTKRISGPVVATAGIGWGRLGSHNSFNNPLGVISSRFDTRDAGYTGTGGRIESARWFRGPAAFLPALLGQ